MLTALTDTRDRDTPAGVLSAIATAREAARQAEIDTIHAALAWADMHSVDSLDHAATVPGTDRALAIAGEGAPLVAEFAIAELATALGRSADSTRHWLGTLLELRHRLPRAWARVLDGPLEPWKALRIAEATLTLCEAAAGWVDVHAAPVAHKIGPVQLERLVTEAIRRFDPEQAYDDELAATEHRHVSIHGRDIAAGCGDLTATLDVIDLRDVDQALAKVAHDLLLAGCTASLDVRRALALGEIARHELHGHPCTANASTDTEPVSRDATLYVHIDADALELLDDETALDQSDAHIEKAGSARDFTVGIDRLKSWLTRPGTRISIRPVIDLNSQLTSTGYQTSQTLREQVILCSPRCVFPHCNRSARSADLDHIDPWEHGGKTESRNLAPLCRLHHRVKTHAGWAYTRLSPGEYLWRSPHAHTFHVDPTGTTPIKAPCDGP